MTNGNKELDRKFGLNWYDHGARHNDAAIGRWHSIDKNAEKYYGISPYAYCVGAPISGIDMDGKKVIWINGWTAKKNIGNNYWGIFLSLVANLYNENKDNYAFYDGSIGGIENTITHLFSPEHSISNLNLCYQNRYNMGYEQGVLDRNEIINSLKKDKSGRIVEQIRIIAHSMGAAYAKGFAQALVEFAQMFPNLCEGLRIVEYDFAPYQPEQQTSVAGVDTYQFSHKDDWIAGFNPEKGNVTYLDPFIAKGTSHSLSSFEEEIYNLKEGRYIFENGKFIYVGSPKY